MKHGHYKKDVSRFDLIDVYRVLDLFEVTCPVAQHVVKKALAAGKRGHKDLRKDWQDIIDSAERKLEMLREDREAEPVVDWPETDERIDTIGPNGNEGEHYASVYIGGAAHFDDSANFDPVSP